MDLLTTVPDFPIEPYARILPDFEKAGISVKELLLLDTLEIAKRTRIPVADVRRLTSHVLEALHQDLGLQAYQASEEENESVAAQAQHVSGSEDAPRLLQPPSLSFISTLDPVLDDALSGGISTSYVTEIAGESGSGKTQLLLHLLLSVQLPPPYGLCKRALYVSTEAGLATNRLSQILDEHPRLSSLPTDVERPSLDNVLGITTVDLETQDHILNHHLPFAISKYDIGLVVIDSITANYRVETTTNNFSGLLDRAWQFKKLGQLLRNLAVRHNIAIVVSNQVSDRLNQLDGPLWAEEPDYLLSRLEETPSTQQYLDSSQHLPSSSTCQSSAPHLLQRQLQSQATPTQDPTPLTPENDTGSRAEPSRLNIRSLSSLLSYAYQQPFYTGWGDPYELEACKTPALGLVWTNQLGCRVILKVHEFPNIDIVGLGPEIVVNASAELSNLQQVEGGVIQGCSKENVQGHHILTAERNDQPCEPEVEEKRGIEHRADDHNSNPETQPPSHLTSETMLPSQSSRRRRTMQVVFSPWTSGRPHAALEDDQEAPSLNPSNGMPFNLPVEEAEFEILPGGIRGIP
ncbi:predicted protein [Uncinocarpus reesii 1704]|uniref:RecA family profile 1 domain-containing protein n=1 Tax=Uncinocarpus reesii (strain UAMH 1704) TaxID=336963 RepID=C4JLA7_UNCRE|nr:uncharacterized protein UREG_03615 [Uncinocarpus reesii 1704]EEP78769.1 predicted protein [Uncinocarpus reesii 1704]